MKNSRRDFLKKAAISGVALETGLLLASGIVGCSDQNSNSNLPPPTNPNEENYWLGIQKLFRLPKAPTYFNNAGLGATPNPVLDALVQHLTEFEDSVISGHRYIDDYRNYIAGVLNCPSEDLCFTRNATEGMNIVANGIKLQETDEVLLTNHEHVGATIPWISATNRAGAKLKLVELDLTGENNLQNIKSAITRNTKIIVCSHVTCTTGMILPVKELSSWCKENGILLCIDGAQAVGMIPVDLTEIDPDFYTTSGHKWVFGPKGTGLFYASKRNLDQIGSAHVGAYSDAEYNLADRVFKPHPNAGRFEYGTRNIAMYAALKAAFEFTSSIGFEKLASRGMELTSYLSGQIENSVTILSPLSDTYRSSILTFKANTISYGDFQNELQADQKFKVRGIYEADLDAIRISMACYNTENEVDELAKWINRIAGN